MAIDPAISLAIGLSLAILLAASAAHKLFGFRPFVGVVRNYDLAPASIAAVIAVALIVVEAVLAIGLAMETFRGVAAFGAAAIFSAYGAAIAINMHRGRVAIDCGCSFGAAADRLSLDLLYRNAALVAGALIAAAPVSDRALGVFDYVSAGLFCATAAALYLAFEALHVNAARLHATERSR